MTSSPDRKSETVARLVAEAVDAREPDLGPCAICGRPATADYRPFCTRRCADIDLARWLKGSYAIPAKEEPEGDSEDEA